MARFGVLAVDGVPRHYEWGSHTAIPELLGVAPDGRPVAELWFGAHSDDPSPVAEHDAALDHLITSAPDDLLGSTTVDRFGARLPYLLKILAADKVLSIQVHPSAEQAREGFAREDEAGVPRDAPQRNYRDPYPKPELLCALTQFDALCGFRPVAATLDLIDSLRLPELRELRNRLGGPDGLREAFTYLLRLDDASELVQAVAAAADGHANDQDSPLRPVAIAASDFPGDVGAVLALLLNYVHLEPGEAIFLGAGNVHAYLRGMGVEVMANSDNVLRCGLTPKHVDVAELLRITDFSELTEPRWHPVGGRFAVPVPEFALTRLVLGAASPGGTRAGEVGPRMSLDDPGPALVLCTSGGVRVGDVAVQPGHAAFVPGGFATSIEGEGVVFVATVGD